MADKTVLLGQIVAEQEDFAALLRGMTDEQWAASSLCEGWTVRDTAIHTAWRIISSGSVRCHLSGMRAM